jgi:hypothetical protein
MIEKTIETCRNYSAFAEESLGRLLVFRNEVPKSSSVRHRIDWFLQSPEYRTWSSWADTSVRPTQFLWYTGRPGTGKTGALISVVKELLDTFHASPTLDVVYFFCSPPTETGATIGRSSTATADILRSLIAQLVCRDKQRFYGLTSDDQERIRSIFNPVLELLHKAFWNLIGLLLRSRPDRRVHIIIDGLDAIRPEEDRILFTNELRRLWDSLVSEPKMNLKILVTSRPYAPIRDAFAHLPFIDPFTEVMGWLPPH